MKNELLEDILAIGGDIVASERFRRAEDVPHHSKSGNIALHSLETAGYALLLARWLAGHSIMVNEEDAVRASLLHDIGMTEEDVFLSPAPKKAFTHPRVGARIAQEEFGANDTQVEAIRHHMWPICVIPPHTVVGWVVTTADKCCSMQELGRSTEEIVDAVGKRLLRLFRLGSR